MNQKQSDSLAKYCYDMSKAVHVGWMIGVATDKVSLIAALVLFILGVDLFIVAYRQEEE